MVYFFLFSVYDFSCEVLKFMCLTKKSVVCTPPYCVAIVNNAENKRLYTEFTSGFVKIILNSVDV